MLIWPCISLAMVGCAYLTNNPEVFGKSDSGKGKVRNPDEAIALLQSKRPLVRLNKSQKKCAEEVCKILTMKMSADQKDFSI